METKFTSRMVNLIKIYKESCMMNMGTQMNATDPDYFDDAK